MATRLASITAWRRAALGATLVRVLAATWACSIDLMLACLPVAFRPLKVARRAPAARGLEAKLAGAAWHWVRDAVMEAMVAAGNEE